MSTDSTENQYFVLAYYRFVDIEQPRQEVLRHKEFFQGRDVAGRIYLSERGINGQMSGARRDAEAYMQWMHAQAPFKDMVFKIHYHHENVFAKLTVKYRPQLVALDREVDMSQGGEHVSPEQWRKMLEGDEKALVLDVRNHYEWAVGRFEGAELPPCDTFREFSDYAEDLKNRADLKKTPVMMYCTGGIRCELYSALLKEKGFEHVYQLDGGVINYGLKEGSKHWLGKLFVFDDRLTAPISDEPAQVIGKCHHCGASHDIYYNCANMDCNHLFICCQKCLTEFAGCCQSECAASPRTRPYHQQQAHKPFRKRHNYERASTT